MIFFVITGKIVFLFSQKYDIFSLISFNLYLFSDKKVKFTKTNYKYDI